MKIRIVLLILLVFPMLVNAQHGRRMKKKVSYAEGTLFAYWGYNRSGFTKSNIRFAGPGYDFTMQGATAYDERDPATILSTQFNARLGYYFRDHWAISAGIDRMTYLFADNNQVNLSGSIDETVDAQWEGTYTGEPITTDRELFHYANSNGLNYLRLELTRTDMLFNAGDRDWFAVSSNIGVGAGGLLSSNSFTFAGRENKSTGSMSGYGISAHLGLRFEFLRHVFLQTGFSGGLNHQLKVHTRPNDPSSFARQAYGYIMFDASVGFLFYIRSKNGCDSCPVW